jgi:hypothetical protein
MKKIVFLVAAVLVSQVVAVGSAFAARGTVTPVSCNVSSDSLCNAGVYELIADAFSQKVANSVKAKVNAQSSDENEKKFCAVVRSDEGICSIRFNDGAKVTTTKKPTTTAKTCLYNQKAKKVSTKCNTRCPSAQRTVGGKKCCQDFRAPGIDQTLGTSDDVCSRTALK